MLFAEQSIGLAKVSTTASPESIGPPPQLLLVVLEANAVQQANLLLKHYDE